jgi:V/A-type H+-transporting ATPase subunit E
MTGLEKILNAIEADAKHAADVVLKQAKQEAEQIMATAKALADEKCAEIASRAELDVQAAISRGESAAALQEKKALLDAKQHLISDIIGKARKSLDSLPEQEYTELILKLVSKYAHQKPGKILFSAADKKRLPADIDKRIKDALAGKKKAELTVSEENAEISGGFLLVYGDIEENCTFDALFEAAREDLQDKVNAFLFTASAASR